MSIRNLSKTKTSFRILIIHLLYAVLFTTFMLITSLLEVHYNQDGIYAVFAAISIALIFFYPLIATLINTISIFFQVLALINGESKSKNIIMMVIAILYEVTVIILFTCFWRRIMGI